MPKIIAKSYSSNKIQNTKYKNKIQNYYINVD